MAYNLEFRAGRKARALISDRGLSADMVRVIAGAAGGPKWIILNGLDRAVFFEWLKDIDHTVFLVGSSIGAWRFAAVSHKDPANALETFKTEYIEQRYDRPPTPQELTDECIRILRAFIGDPSKSGILEHSRFRLGLFSDRCHGLVARDEKIPLSAGLALTAICNAISRKSLEYFFNRTLFYDPRDIPPFMRMNGFPLDPIPLNAENLIESLSATGAIPLAMSGIRNIIGAPAGMYRDGGLMDYHLDIPYSVGNEEIVLYPHFFNRVVPGWFDKALPWRKAGEDNMSSVLLVCPTQEFIDRLPLKKIPDRNDFYRFRNRNDERIRYWRAVHDISERLGDEFLEAAYSGSLCDRVMPL